jgi:hypothetical protein
MKSDYFRNIQRLSIFSIAIYVVVWFIIPVIAWANDGKRCVDFNYYSRSYFGDVKVKQIDASGLIIELPRYRATYTNDELKEIKGYYHGTDTIKFTDQFRNGRLQHSSYCDYQGNEVLNKIFLWKKGNLAQITIRCNLGETSFYSYEQFEQKNENSVWYRAQKELSRQNFNLVMITEGWMMPNYTPIKMRAKLHVSNGSSTQEYLVEQVYDYTDDGRLDHFTARLSNGQLLNESQYEYSGNKLVRELRKSNGGELVREFIYDKNIMREYNNVGSDEMTLYIDAICSLSDEQLSLCSFEAIPGGGSVINRLQTLDEEVRYVIRNGKLSSIYKTLKLDTSFTPIVEAFPVTIEYRYFVSHLE